MRGWKDAKFPPDQLRILGIVIGWKSNPAVRDSIQS
jgi:hypothetical protein